MAPSTRSKGLRNTKDNPNNVPIISQRRTTRERRGPPAPSPSKVSPRSKPVTARPEPTKPISFGPHINPKCLALISRGSNSNQSEANSSIQSSSASSFTKPPKAENSLKVSFRYRGSLKASCGSSTDHRSLNVDKLSTRYTDQAPALHPNPHTNYVDAQKYIDYTPGTEHPSWMDPNIFPSTIHKADANNPTSPIINYTIQGILQDFTGILESFANPATAFTLTTPVLTPSSTAPAFFKAYALLMLAQSTSAIGDALAFANRAECIFKPLAPRAGMWISREGAGSSRSLGYRNWNLAAGVVDLLTMQERWEKLVSDADGHQEVRSKTRGMRKGDGMNDKDLGMWQSANEAKKKEEVRGLKERVTKRRKEIAQETIWAYEAYVKVVYGEEVEFIGAPMI